MNTVSSDMRDGHTHNARETLRVTDVKILQKVNAVNREAFVIRFPGQVEHHMRLVSERLQACLVKPPGIDLGQPSTWPAGSEDLLNLAMSLKHLNEVRRDWPINEST